MDHIVPRKLKGSNDITNLQALCFKCNAMKRHTDNTDFRNVNKQYQYREEGCAHCYPETGAVKATNELAYSISSDALESQGHTLIIPKRHVKDYFELFQPEMNAIQQLLVKSKTEVERADSSVAGFSVRFESMRCPDRTNLHCNIDLIPQRGQDMRAAP